MLKLHTQRSIIKSMKDKSNKELAFAAKGKTTSGVEKKSTNPRKARMKRDIANIKAEMKDNNDEIKDLKTELAKLRDELADANKKRTEFNNSVNKCFAECETYQAGLHRKLEGVSKFIMEHVVPNIPELADKLNGSNKKAKVAPTPSTSQDKKLKGFIGLLSSLVDKDNTDMQKVGTPESGSGAKPTAKKCDTFIDLLGYDTN